MPKKNPAFDKYIAKSAEFARPILEKIRRLFHEACPDIEETIKWGRPHFDHKGVVGGMAAFKEHASFGFWKGELLSDPHNLFSGVGNTSVHMAKITNVSELPSDKVLLAYIREAVALNEQGVKPPPKKRVPKKEMEVPKEFLAALRKNKKALVAFDAFSPSHQREYVEWIADAKQEATRAKRIATALEWLAEGKPRNWKYMRK
jgi:uncharacterized protein YdeI (YjbR/CyaY-like superfamily)